jgi:hypothetical protein
LPAQDRSGVPIKRRGVSGRLFGRIKKQMVFQYGNRRRGGSEFKRPLFACNLSRRDLPEARNDCHYKKASPHGDLLSDADGKGQWKKRLV